MVRSAGDVHFLHPAHPGVPETRSFIVKRALLLAILVAPVFCHGQLVVGVTARDAGTRDRILRVAAGLVGTVEKTGNNDGAKIDAILASVGLEGTGAPWCAAANRFVYDAAHLRTAGPRSALAAAWVSSPTWTAAKGGRTPLPGDPWGIWFASKGRVAHTGLVRTWGAQVVVTFEGNTSPDAVPGSASDREGDGYWSKRRLIRQIYSVRDWID